MKCSYNTSESRLRAVFRSSFTSIVLWGLLVLFTAAVPYTVAASVDSEQAQSAAAFDPPDEGMAGTIIVNPETFNTFSYEVGEGPSDAQEFTISTGESSFDALIISVPESSPFEICIANESVGTECSNEQDYIAGGTTTYSIRLRSGLPTNSYTETLVSG